MLARAPTKALSEHLGAALGTPDAAERVKARGNGIGPPWAEDQRIAATAAWLALAALE